jgi:glycosyltransferase involved in cell wall biosynthesis
VTDAPFFTIVIPVYNGGFFLHRCLQALAGSTFQDWELLVVDDGSTDGSAGLAKTFGAGVLETTGRIGPAAARNLGARSARGQYLYFIDADCAVHPDTLARSAQILRSDPQLDALFGSYDDEPGAANFVAQYKNLFHHYVHQNSREEAATFWTGCGAIRRSRFLALGGFAAERYRRPSIEDIELGHRLCQAGSRIHLARQVQVKHLKAWTLAGLVRSDILDRGIPWTRLMLRDGVFRNDLNLQSHNRISVVVVYGLLAALAAWLLFPPAIWLAIGLAGLLFWLNLNLYRFFYRKRGLFFALQVIPLHWLYYIYNAISFGCGLLLHWREQVRPQPGSTSAPVINGAETDGS